MILSRFRFTEKEIKELLFSTLALAFIFGYPGLGESFFSELFSYSILYFIIIIFAFIPHELAHKFMAIKYGFFAQYKMWKGGLKFALFLALLTNGNFVFAAPGAVMIYPAIDQWGRHRTLSPKQNAIVSLLGPGMNIFVALLAITFASAINSVFNPLLMPLGFSENMAAVSIIYVNSLIAFFNLIPFPPLDGSKIFAWRKDVWAIMIVLTWTLLRYI